MNFDYIELSKEEIQRLCQIAKAPNGLPSGTNEKKLMEYRFIARNWYHVQSEDGERKMEPVSVIEPKGEEYLRYYRRKRKDLLWSNGLQIINLILALIAAITGIIAVLD